MNAPVNPSDVAKHLGALAGDLSDTVRQLEVADMDATEKRHAHNLAYSRAFLVATGAMELRKHTAIEATADNSLTADVADAVVRHLKRRIDEIKTRIDVGRSYGSAIKAELEYLKSGVST